MCGQGERNQKAPRRWLGAVEEVGIDFLLVLVLLLPPAGALAPGRVGEARGGQSGSVTPHTLSMEEDTAPGIGSGRPTYSPSPLVFSSSSPSPSQYPLARYESCETALCSPASDYRLEQCRGFNGNNFKIEGLPEDVKWVPKYTGSE